MIRVTVKLVLIFLLVTAGVYLWYGRLEKQLLQGVISSGKDMTGKTAKAGSRGLPDRDTSSPESGKIDFQIIVKRNIFEASLEAAQDVPEKVVEQVAPTSLDLTLLGTVTGSDQDARAIIIDNKEKRQDIYQIGDAVQGAFVDSIERGKITLDVNGKKEALLIKDREGGGPGPPKIPPSSRPRTAGKPAEKIIQRKAPRVRPNRRISFRQDPNRQPETGPDIVEEEQTDMESGIEEDLTGGGAGSETPKSPE